MPLAWPRLHRSRAMWVAIATASGAAALVLYLQHRALSALEAQTGVILRQISEQTAADIAQSVRRALDGPVFETLTAVNHPELRAGRLDLVAREYERGLHDYPHVERFLVWSAETEAKAPGEVMFYRRAVPGGEATTGIRPGPRFSREPTLGRALLALAHQHAASQQIYVAAGDLDGDGGQVFLRLFWNDATRVDFFAVLGFLVSPSLMREALIPTLYARELQALVARRGGELPLQLRVLDELGATVFGQPSPGETSASVEVPMLIYPGDRIDSRLATSLTAPTWRIEVSAPRRDALLGGMTRSYWPTLVSVLLMMVAVGLTLQASQRSADLAQMQSDFISHASHQLKTPLSLLSAATETLQMERVRSPEKLAEYLGIIRGEVARLTTLVQRVLEFSRLQQRRTYELEQVDLGALVGETVDAFAGSLGSQHMAFEIAPPTNTVLVRADPAALEQVLANLLDNAVKYSGESKRVSVRVGASDRLAIVDVLDTGVGIPRAEQTRIFERFYRGSTGSHLPGFGLGLPIVQEVVRAHGGQVEVESEPGKGSRFRLVLPRQLESVRPAARFGPPSNAR